MLMQRMLPQHSEQSLMDAAARSQRHAAPTVGREQESRPILSCRKRMIKRLWPLFNIKSFVTTIQAATSFVVALRTALRQL